MRDNAKDEDSNPLFNRVDAGNKIHVKEVTTEDCTACYIYRDMPWSQNWPARQQFGGMNEFPLDFTLFIHAPTEGTDLDKQWSALRYQLIHWLENPDDDDSRGMEWYYGQGGLFCELKGNQVISFEKTNSYLVNGERKEVKHPIYAANLRIMAKVWNQAESGN